MGVAYKLQTNYASESMTDQQCRQSHITAGVDTAAVRLAIIPRQGTTMDSSMVYTSIQLGLPGTTVAIEATAAVMVLAMDSP